MVFKPFDNFRMDEAFRATARENAERSNQPRLR
ncbi:hypothetical protein T08_10201 [Trichinella sp. T8]|nr:hypothetical protein T08_10201 [Trichinella sp. T8]